MTTDTVTASPKAADTTTRSTESLGVLVGITFASAADAFNKLAWALRAPARLAQAFLSAARQLQASLCGSRPCEQQHHDCPASCDDGERSDSGVISPSRLQSAPRELLASEHPRQRQCEPREHCEHNAPRDIDLELQRVASHNNDTERAQPARVHDNSRSEVVATPTSQARRTDSDEQSDAESAEYRPRQSTGVRRLARDCQSGGKPERYTSCNPRPIVSRETRHHLHRRDTVRITFASAADAFNKWPRPCGRQPAWPRPSLARPVSCKRRYAEASADPVRHDVAAAAAEPTGRCSALRERSEPTEAQVSRSGRFQSLRGLATPTIAKGSARATRAV